MHLIFILCFFKWMIAFYLLPLGPFPPTLSGFDYAVTYRAILALLIFIGSKECDLWNDKYQKKIK